MSNKKEILEDLKQKILDFYFLPNSIRETARHFNFSYSYIRRLFKLWNIPVHDHKTLVNLSLKKMINTNLEKYGVKIVSQSDAVLAKMKATCVEKYGSEWGFGSEEIKKKIKETFKSKYGVEYLLQNKKLQNKAVNAKRKHNTFNSSKSEDRCFNELLKFYNAEDIFRNYNKDYRYPFMCDFYILSKDLFIELNFHWTHGKHLFNEKNPKDLKIVEVWKNKKN